jgi:hypothetical protein
MQNSERKAHFFGAKEKTTGPPHKLNAQPIHDRLDKKKRKMKKKHHNKGSPLHSPGEFFHRLPLGSCGTRIGSDALSVSGNQHLVRGERAGHLNIQCSALTSPLGLGEEICKKFVKE